VSDAATVVAVLDAPAAGSICMGGENAVQIQHSNIGKYNIIYIYYGYNYMNLYGSLVSGP
jgi:hypothetical protein